MTDDACKWWTVLEGAAAADSLNYLIRFEIVNDGKEIILPDSKGNQNKLVYKLNCNCEPRL